MQRDEKFKQPRIAATDFDFGKDTARVFDDMLDRSVPFYAEIQRMLGEMAAEFVTPGSRVYDLGCSTGNTLIALDPALPPGVELVGIDASSDMLDLAGQKLNASQLAHPWHLVCQNLEQELQLTDASVVIMNLTLQFVRPLSRDLLVRRIADGLREDGCFLLVEKVLGPNSRLNRQFIKHYYDFKRRNGYSDMEIAQKREALENVLIPYQFHENQELLLRNGFAVCDIFFRWYNFCGMVALK